MDVLDVLVAAASAVVAALSAVVACRARGDSNRAATAAEAAEHRASRPRLLVEPEGEISRNATAVIYRVHNLDGPDLTSVVIHRPATGPTNADGVVYPVAATGRSDYGDTAEIGPIALAQYGRFTLSIGNGEKLPEFRIRITCRAAQRPPWELGETLATPRGPAQVAAEEQRQQREDEERRALDAQDVQRAWGVSYYLRGGAGIGSSGPQWEMTTLHVALRNDSELIASGLQLTVGDSDFTWTSAEPIPPGQQLAVQVNLDGALPYAPESESGGRPFESYESRLEFTLGGRRYVRRGEARPTLNSRRGR